MPNGGHICCEYCTYNRSTPGRCDLFGVETSPFVLCRAFRKPKQSHSEARKQWPMLSGLEPGVVYAIDNSTYGIHDLAGVSYRHGGSGYAIDNSTYGIHDPKPVWRLSEI